MRLYLVEYKKDNIQNWRPVGNDIGDAVFTSKKDAEKLAKEGTEQLHYAYRVTVWEKVSQ